MLTAQEALALGMVTRVVPDAEVEAAAHELAMSLAQGPSVTLGYIKRNINNAETLSLEACFDAEAIHHSRSGETADHKEAAKAFVEKRKPVFQGALRWPAICGCGRSAWWRRVSSPSSPTSPPSWG